MVVIALIGLAGDQASKALAFAPTAGAGGPRKVAPGLIAGVLAENDGCMANLAGGYSITATILGLSSLVELGLATGWAYRSRERWRRRDAVFGGLLAAGMLGNAVDRLVLGYVRDFLVTTLWPSWIFNLADVLIVIGVLLLLGSRAVLFLARTGQARSDTGRPTAIVAA
jgi:signal peptidase II